MGILWRGAWTIQDSKGCWGYRLRGDRFRIDFPDRSGGKDPCKDVRNDSANDRMRCRKGGAESSSGRRSPFQMNARGETKPTNQDQRSAPKLKVKGL